MNRHPARFVVGPDGYPLTAADLPAQQPRRWLSRRKAQVVAAVASGLITREQVCDRYRLTPVELLTWESSIELFSQTGKIL
jgi:hypothetical protein